MEVLGFNSHFTKPMLIFQPTIILIPYEGENPHPQRLNPMIHPITTMGIKNGYI